MLSNFHTHSTFCDGQNTAEEVILKAIEKNFISIGFSSHGYTDFDLRYCMKDTDGYIAEINRLKEKYKDKIQVYLGVEEDAFSYCNRSEFDYIIGSSHYFKIDDKYYPIDSNYDYFKECLKVFNYDVIRLAETYYSNFCNYICSRKPDIIGHFDLITKFDELDESLFLENAEYNKIAEKYVSLAADSECVFELNTGAISRGFRTKPYPNENLLHILKEKNSKIILASDSHSVKTLDSDFDYAKDYLKYLGFKNLYTLYNNKFTKYDI